MSNFSALNAALSGIQTNLRGLHRAAHEIATGGGDRGEPAGLVEPLVRSIVHQRGLEASANVLRRSDEMLGTLIDTFS